MPTPVPLHNLRILAIAGLLTACSGDAAGPANEQGSEPRYDVTVTMRYLEVTSSEACDGVGLINGEARDGEFQYRIEVLRGDQLRASMESDNYGSAFGYSFSRLPGELINFANRDFKFESLEPEETVTIRFFGSEWDEFGKDSRMDHRRTDLILPQTFGWEVGTIRDIRVSVPSNGSLVCELTLVWDMSVTKRMVPTQ
jgi:hypothetical protein